MASLDGADGENDAWAEALDRREGDEDTRVPWRGTANGAGERGGEWAHYTAVAAAFLYFVIISSFMSGTVFAYSSNISDNLSIPSPVT